MPLFAGSRRRTRLWTPKDIGSSLVLWLDASDLNTIVLNSGNVAQWLDKSGAQNHVSQATAANQPAMGNRFVNFTAATQQLLTPGNANLPLGSSPRSVISLFAATQTLTSASVIGYGGTGTNERINIIEANGHTPFFAYGTNNGDPGYADDLLPCLASIRYTPIQLANEKNGRVYSIGNTSRTLATIASPLWLGTIPLNTRGALLSKHYEHIMLSSGADQVLFQKIEGYMMHKQGFAASLTADHPYRLRPPIVTY